MSSRNRSATAAAAAPAPAAAPSLRTPRRLRRRPVKASASASAPGGGRRSGPSTPLLKWDVGGGRGGEGRKPGGGEEAGASAREKQAREVSVRRLAAGVWRLRPPEAVPGAAARAAERRVRVGVEHIPRHLQVQLLKQNTSGHHQSLKNEVSSPISVLERKSGEPHKVQLHATSTTMEKATKWEPEDIKGLESHDAYLIASQLNLLDEQQDTTYVANLQMELQQARDRVSELETERRSAKKKLDHLFKKLAEEKAAWRNREHEKVRAILEDMKADLDHEKKNRRRLEMINLKLVNELKEAKMSAKQLLQEYETERKARELTEEVCNELAREVEEDKAEIEALKQDSLKLREEVDEERKMLQMAEVWREERVQMKLVDAKLTLDAKYAQLSKLQQGVEAFIASCSCTNGDITVVEEEAENIIQAIKSVRAQDAEFRYEPPAASEDIFSIFEELRPSEEPVIKEIEPCYRNNSAKCESEIQEASPMTDIFLEKKAKVYSNKSPQDESDTEDGSSWETIGHEDMQGSSGSPDGSESSVNNKICDGSISWKSGNDFEYRGNEKLKDDLTDAYLTNMNQPKKKESAISKLWKSSRPKNSDICKKDAVETVNARSSNVRLSVGTYSTVESGIQEIGLSPPSVGQWSSPDSMNIQFNRGFKGCIEYPRTSQKHSLKAKLMEARMESQKVQLRQVLKQKI
ncbi:CAP-Gly domain-containing linker protein 1-like [Panicum miliaceum]|uniref:CAP-Gly domain-containing linker protein 1-like n=1 Tax=Panicum miliaceum TaxID=4540 RepID=A0A3L6Q3V6_PANMI|nr:CAP-Gly domain-containing linker protein 1-like [Panicum miliaceum]